jgi:hypothetical protein
MYVFILNINIPETFISGNYNSIYEFLYMFYISIKPFDIMWITIFVLIFNFYYGVYFDKKVIMMKRIVMMLVSIFLAILIVMMISLVKSNNLKIIFYSLSQLYKCFLIVIGYSFIIYACLKKIYLKIVSLKSRVRV